MKYRFSELVDIPKVQVLCENFTQLTGFTTAILDMDGTVLVSTGWQQICEQFHRVNARTAANCLKSDIILADRLSRGEKYALYLCENGLIDVAVPIVIDSVQMGRFYSGQFLLAPPDMDYFRQQAAEYGFEESAYLDAVAKVPVVTEERVRQVMAFLTGLVEMISGMGLANKKIEDAEMILRETPLVFFRGSMSPPDFPVDFVSENVTKLGYTPEMFTTGKIPRSSLTHPDDLAPVAAHALELQAAGNDLFHMEYRMIAGDGSVRWVEERTNHKRDENGRVTHYSGVMIDITDRKHMEEALKLSERKYRDIVESAPVGIFRSSKAGKLLSVNPAMARMFRYDSPEEMIRIVNHRGMAKTIYGDPARRLETSSHDSNDDWQVFEGQFRCKDGSIITCNCKFRSIAEADCNVAFDGFIEDVTERRQSEDEESFFKTLVENTRDPVCVLDPSDGWKIVYVNQAACTHFGKEYDELLTMRIPDWDPVFRMELLDTFWLQAKQGISPRFETTHRVTSGQLVPVEISAHFLEHNGKETSACYFHDITKRKHMETSLRESEQKFRTLAENSPNLIMRYDRYCRCIYANPAFSRITGTSLGKNCESIPAGQWPGGTSICAEEYTSRLRTVIETGNPEEILMEWHHPETGEMIIHSMTIVAEHNAAGEITGCLVIGHDISEHERTIKKLLAKREQLAAMAVDLSLAEERERRRIAAELHDHIGQLLLLCKIKFGSLPQSILCDNDEETYLEAMDLLSRAIRDVRSMTQQLNPPLLASCGLVAALEWLAKVMEADFSLHVKCSDDGSHKPLSEELSYVLFQSARELLINVAKHAGCGEARLSTVREADTLVLEVEDQGCGFTCDFDSAARCDYSFGLFNIRQRIKQLGGELSIKSEPGHGVHVTIRVPLLG